MADPGKPLRRMKMDQKLSQSATWTLILVGCALLVAMGKLDLLVVLIPTAAVLAYGISWIFQGKRPETNSLK
jgi:hypothetical protein